MNRLFVLVLLLISAHLTFGQSNSFHSRHDQLEFRASPMTLNPAWAPFYHGVASGDPLEDRVIIWTRVTPESDGMDQMIDVTWEVATDPEMSTIVQMGTTSTDASKDYTVKVDVTGLTAGTTYYYHFIVDQEGEKISSLVGKTKTTPTGDQVSEVRFGVVSCSNFPAGYFSAYQNLAERRDLDAIIHLGDYIYEYANGVYGDTALVEARAVEPNKEIITLEDYRTRYSTYRLDSSLASVHQQHPFIVVWDDHESSNDAYKDGAENHTTLEEGEWEARKTAAKQAYFEWLPIRDNSTQSVYRKISYGNLLDLIMLDTRLEGREKQILDINAPELLDTNRTLLGAEQKAWFLDQLKNSTAQWKVIGQQVIFAELNVGYGSIIDPNLTFESAEAATQDIWDGYPAERKTIINFLETESIDNVVILTGDFHSSFAFEVTETPVNLSFAELPVVGLAPVYSPSETYNPETGEGSVAVEFATPSITSANFDENFDLQTATLAQDQINKDIDVAGLVNLGNPNPHIKFADLIQHGYMIIDVQADRAQADWYFTDISQPVNEVTFAQGWYTNDGENKLTRDENESSRAGELDTPAPMNPLFTTSVNEQALNVTVLANFPNPAQSFNQLNYAVQEAGRVKIDLMNAGGQQIETLMDTQHGIGLYSLRTEVEAYPAGIYFYRISMGNAMKLVRFVVQ